MTDSGRAPCPFAHTGDVSHNGLQQIAIGCIQQAGGK